MIRFDFASAARQDTYLKNATRIAIANPWGENLVAISGHGDLPGGDSGFPRGNFSRREEEREMNARGGSSARTKRGRLKGELIPPRREEDGGAFRLKGGNV